MFAIDEARAAWRLITVLSRGLLATFFWLSDCTPKHPFVDPAPAYEESPDWLSARKHSLYDRPVRRGSSQSHQRPGRWQASAEIYCHTQTDPSPRGSLPKQRPMQSRLAVASFHHLIGYFIPPWRNLRCWLGSTLARIVDSSQRVRCADLQAASLSAVAGLG